MLLGSQPACCTPPPIFQGDYWMGTAPACASCWCHLLIQACVGEGFTYLFGLTLDLAGWDQGASDAAPGSDWALYQVSQSEMRVLVK